MGLGVGVLGWGEGVFHGEEFGVGFVELCGGVGGVDDAAASEDAHVGVGGVEVTAA